MTTKLDLGVVCTKITALRPFAIYAAQLPEPTGNIFRGRGLCVRESSCGLVEIGEFGRHDLAAALAAAVIVPNEFR